MLTFDDGGTSAYEPIADELESKGWRGHFFVTTDMIGNSTFLSPRQICELAERGHTIGTHSCSHPRRMSACDWDGLLREWGESAARLSDLLGVAVQTASVPGGFYSTTVAKAAAAAGLKALFTSEPTTRCVVVDDCLVLGRYAVRRSTGPARAARLASGRLLPRYSQAAFWGVKKLAKLLGGTSYLRLRNWIYR